MYLHELKLANFKNCASADLVFSDKVNCFVGSNGAGKTNILDAIYCLSFCKSFFTSTDKLNIRHGEDFFSIHGVYSEQGKDNELVSCIQKKESKKSFKFNKKEYERLSDHIGKYPLVMVSPYDRDLINESGDMRRRFMDSVISQFDPVYLLALQRYSRALQQRNTLIKQFNQTNTFNKELLAVWDDHLIINANDIYEKRKKFIEDFQPVFQKSYALISGGEEQVGLNYVSKLDEMPMRQLLEETRQHDLFVGYTTAGVHKDDIEMLLDNHALKRYGSQGQQKSFVVAIRLAQYDHIQKMLNIKPIILFDDIFDKLDDERVRKIVGLVGDNSFGQVFITDTSQGRINSLFEGSQVKHKIFVVRKGQVDEINNTGNDT